MGDGLYYNAAVASSESRPNLALSGDMDALLEVVEQLKVH